MLTVLKSCNCATFCGDGRPLPNVLQADSQIHGQDECLSVLMTCPAQQFSSALVSMERMQGIDCLLQLRLAPVLRAKFITGSVAELMTKPGGGHAWLHSLRHVPYPEASAALCSLPGVGPKVPASALPCPAMLVKPHRNSLLGAESTQG